MDQPDGPSPEELKYAWKRLEKYRQYQKEYRSRPEVKERLRKRESIRRRKMRQLIQLAKEAGLKLDFED